MNRLELTFGQVETVLSRLNRISDEKRGAFVGRLKFLQRNGVPQRDTPGRGKAGTYTLEQLFELALAVELLQAGLAPQLAARVVKSNWVRLLDDVFSLILGFEMANTDSTNEVAFVEVSWIWLIPLAELQDLSDVDAGRPEPLIMPFSFPAFEAGKNMIGSYNRFGMDRAIAIAPSELYSRLMLILVDEKKYASISDIVEEFEGIEPHLRESALNFSMQMHGKSFPFGTRFPIRKLAPNIAGANTSESRPNERRGLARYATYAFTLSEWPTVISVIQAVAMGQDPSVDNASKRIFTSFEKMHLVERLLDGPFARFTPVGKFFATLSLGEVEAH